MIVFVEELWWDELTASLHSALDRAVKKKKVCVMKPGTCTVEV